MNILRRLSGSKPMAVCGLLILVAIILIASGAATGAAVLLIGCLVMLGAMVWMMGGLGGRGTGSN